VTIRQIEIFHAIIQTGRFRRAAERLYLAQPSVSQQIQSLEEELGERLFVRNKNQDLQLTEAGNILRDHAESILRQCELAKMEIGRLSQEPVGTIRIGVGGHQLTSMLPPALSVFHARFPKVCVDIVNSTSPQLIEMLTSNRLDLAIVNLPIQAPNLRITTLLTEEMVVAVKRTDPLAKKKFITPAGIVKMPLVLYDQTTSTRKRLNEFFQEQKLTPNVIFELSSVEAMKHMVAAGLGASIIPYSALSPTWERHPLRAVRISGAPLKRQLGAALPPLSRMPRLVEEVLQLIEKFFRELARTIPGAESGGA
jgi:DNA-binding transcriptional LysR family regulator